ncbi:hypothetical protein GGR53DRAFT_497516 [Hypoxylon sp. FL1150]|nr:hypothetical protein GGR53DRAFT_497516 [Hypoxylon sp. FL1150]
MLARQRYPAILYAALVSGSLVSQVQGVQTPTCITSCVRQNGCSPTDTACICEKATGGSFLSDVVVCMNQWCSTSTTFADFINPITSGGCDISDKAIQAAESKVGFDLGDVEEGGGDDGSSATTAATATTSTAKASPTGSSKGDVDETTTIASVGSLTKVDGTATTTAPVSTSTATAAKATAASSSESVILSGTTTVGANTASESLLVAASTTLTSTAAAAATTTSTGSDDSDSSSSSSSGGSPADSAPADDSAAAASKAPLLAAVLAVAAAMTFGW